MTSLPLISLLTALLTFLCSGPDTAAACTNLRGCYNGGTLQRTGVSLFHQCQCRCRPGFAGLDCRYKRIRRPVRRSYQPALKSAPASRSFDNPPTVLKRLSSMLKRLTALEAELNER